MGLFGKKKITEQEAVANCLDGIFQNAQQKWPEIKARLADRLIGATDLDDDWSSLEFAMAIVALQAQGLENMMPPDQAQRVRHLILTFFEDCDFAEQAGPVLRAYDSAWGESLRRNEMPFSGAAALLHKQLSCTTTIGDGKYVSPLAIAAISELFVQFGFLGWWKWLMTNYRLVPDD
jgi:hypothetical protein